jgi:hypothetical protein
MRYGCHDGPVRDSESAYLSNSIFVSRVSQVDPKHYSGFPTTAEIAAVVGSVLSKTVSSEIPRKNS